MFSRIRKFIYNHRKKLLISTTVTLASLFFLVRHLHSLFLNHQKRLAEERFNREQIRRRFEQTQKDSLFTIWALVPVLNSSISSGFNVEAITSSLRARRNKDDLSTSSINDELTKKSKNELWDDLKSQSLTKLLTLIYSNALLIIFTRLQLNILARREYLEDALKIASNKHGFNAKISMIDNSNYANEQAYLSFSWWLLNRGWLSLKDKIKSSVDEVFQDINPRVELTIEEFKNLLLKTTILIEKIDVNNDSSFISSVLLPPRNLEIFVVQQILDDQTIDVLQNDSSDLRLLLDETNQYINSSSSLIVLNSLVNSGVNTFVNNIQSDNNKLAVLLAAATKASNDFKVGENDYIKNMDLIPELDELSASVYSNFE